MVDKPGRNKIAFLFQSLAGLDPRRFFVLITLLCGAVYNLVTPPLQAPDEFNHFYRAWQISEGHWLPQKQGQRVGGEIPLGLVHFSEGYMYHAFHLGYAVESEELWMSLKTPLHKEQRVFRDFPNTASYSALSYLPQATAIFLLRSLGATPGVMYYGARWSAYLIWVLSVTLALTLLPARRWLFVLLALLPMQVFVSNSVSADTITNCLSFLFISLVFRFVFSSKRTLKIVWVGLVLLALSLVFAKVVYCGLILLMFVIPAERFGGTGKKLLFVSTTGIVCLVLLAWWSGTVMYYYIPTRDYDPAHLNAMGLSRCGDYEAQKNLILTQPFYFPKVVFNSLTAHPQTWLGSYIGYLGNSDVFLPTWLYVFAWGLILFVVFSDVVLPLRTNAKWIVCLSAGLALVLLLLSQHLLWDCPGEGVVDLLQGRYLIPILPLFLLLPGSVDRLRPFLPLVLVSGLLLIQAMTVTVLWQRYLQGPPAKVQSLVCDMEKTESGRFVSSNEKTELPGAEAQCQGGHGSGGKALCLSPAQPFALDLTLPELHKGDLLEAELWQQGEGALLVFSGGGTNSPQFYSAHALPSSEEEGWTRIRCIFTATSDQQAGAGKFYVWYPGKGTVKVDDLKLTFRQFVSH